MGSNYAYCSSAVILNRSVRKKTIMTYFDYKSNGEQFRRDIIAQTRAMICRYMQISEYDGVSLLTRCKGYDLQILFSEIQPVMILCFSAPISNPCTECMCITLNELNLKGILGCYAINRELDCFSYRAARWLDEPLSPDHFFAFLNHCVDEANLGFGKLH